MSRAWNWRTYPDARSPLGWCVAGIYQPRKRALLESLKLRWRLQLRRWGYV